MNMPTPNGDAWRHGRAKKQLTSDQAADALGIAGGALRQIEGNRKPASLMLAYRAAELYELEVGDLLADDAPPAPRQPEPKPEPAPEPKVERTAPPRRRDERPGPPRVEASTTVGAA